MAAKERLVNKIMHTNKNCLLKVSPQYSRSQWPCGLRRRSSAARLLRSWVRIPPRAWMFVVSVVWCQVEVCATDWSLVQRSPTDCGASLCVIKKTRKNEETKARCRAAEDTTRWVVTPGKQTQPPRTRKTSARLLPLTLTHFTHLWCPQTVEYVSDDQFRVKYAAYSVCKLRVTW